MYEGTHDEKRSAGRLDDEQLERIAQRAAQIVKDEFTLEVGKIALRLALYVCGTGVIALLVWLTVHQKIGFGIGP
jgi:hypothetical protein